MKIDNDTVTEAIKVFGKKHQVLKAIEELAELQQILAKQIGCNESKQDAIAEEMADVFIMLEQLLVIFKNENLVQAYIDLKLTRLNGNIQNVIIQPEMEASNE